MNDVMRLALPLILATACATDELPGSYFDVDRTGAQNGCTGDGTNFRENLPYRIEYRGNEVTLAVEDDVWATGIANGCEVTYRSIVWTSQREGFAIDWQVSGVAQVDPDGGTTCSPEVDWRGTETYLITNSEHPDVSPGCEYVVDVLGNHTQTVE
ncbi:MAG: hypothetical protein AAF602_25295 [Myxococcota bacterium]